VPDESAAHQGTTAIVTLSIIIYVILIGFVIYAAFQFTNWNQTDSIKNFAELITVGLTAASAIMGVAISFISLSKNQTAAAELEKLKTQLQTEVLSKKIWTDLRFEHEKLKATTQRTAYAELWTSVDYAYLLLAKLENSNWKTDDKGLMDNALMKAHAQLVNSPNDAHRLAWEKVRQRARLISEEAAKIDAAGQPALWRKEAADFAGLCRAFKQVAEAEINSPPPQPE